MHVCFQLTVIEHLRSQGAYVGCIADLADIISALDIFHGSLSGLGLAHGSLSGL